MEPNETKLEPPGVRASRLGLERAAISEVWCDYMTRGEPYGASEGEVEQSKAISLKRIADALERRKLTAVDSSIFATASSVTASATATPFDNICDNSGALDIRAIADDAA